MTDLPPDFSAVGDEAPPPVAAATELLDSQSVDEKLSSLQQLSHSLPALETDSAAQTPLTTSIQVDAASTVFYYPAPDMTLHPLLHTLALPYPNSYPSPFQQQQHQLQLQQQYPTLFHQPSNHPPHSNSPTASPSNSSHHPRPHHHQSHRKSNSLTQSHHGPVDPTTLRVPRVYVGNLAFSVGWQDLKDFFRNALGSVGRVDLIAHPSGRSKGCAVVEFDSTEEAGRAINELNNAEIHGRKIFIREDREGKGFGAQSAQRAAAAAQASAMAAAVGAAGGVVDGGGVGGGMYVGGGGGPGLGGVMGAGDVYGGMYGAASPGGYALNMQLYAQYMQQLQQHQLRQQQQQQQQQQQMESFLPGQPQPSSPLPLSMQPMPSGYAGSTLPMPFTPQPPFLSHPVLMAPYPPNRQFIYPPLSPTATATPSTSPPPLMSPSSTTSASQCQLTYQPAATSSALEQQQQQASPHSPRLMLSNLPFSFTRAQLYELTAQYSVAPVRCEIVLDSGTGRSRGVGVAVYSSRAECEQVVDEMRGLVVGERKIHVRRDEYSG